MSIADDVACKTQECLGLDRFTEVAERAANPNRCRQTAFEVQIARTLLSRRRNQRIKSHDLSLQTVFLKHKTKLKVAGTSFCM